MSLSVCEYSDAEKRLIAACSSHWRRIIDRTEINPPNLYDRLALEAFINKEKGPHIEALRRACKALSVCKPYRMTKEFDELCNF